MQDFSWKYRQRILESFFENSDSAPVPGRSAEEPLEALIIGGGIVGVGISRTLALRGVSSLLVEKSDFASGTSCKSSKLIHGGLRYLEMFELGLVFESLSERHWLLEKHPHLVRPLEFVLPVYDKNKTPPVGARGHGLLGIGLWVYDILSLFRTPFFHRWNSVNTIMERFPKIRTHGLEGGYSYADAMMFDEEMVLECAHDAFRRGSDLLNYVSCQSVLKLEEDLFQAILKDEISGRTFNVYGSKVISAVGPWTERFGSEACGGSGKTMKPSKGVHLVFPLARFPIQSCLVMYAPDGRIVFAIPRMDLGEGAEVVIVGTTDSPEKQDPGLVSCSMGDAQYLLQVLKEYFPTAGLTERDVIATYAGVRPLLDDGASTEAKVSREHEIWKNDAGIYFVAGGKYTTFRTMSDEVVDTIFPESSWSSGRETSRKPMSLPEEYNQRFEGGRVVMGRFTESWFKYQVRHRMVIDLEDLVYRRSPLWFLGRQVSVRQLENLYDLCLQVDPDLAELPGFQSRDSAVNRVLRKLRESSTL